MKLLNAIARDAHPEWCMALYGNHDEHQCHKKPGHKYDVENIGSEDVHECYCGVWW